MPDRQPELRERIRELELQVARLEELLEVHVQREAIAGPRRTVRLAKTSAKSPGSYPAASTTPDTYWVKFLDSTFTESEGDQTPTDTARQADGAALAHCRSQNYVPEGTVVMVFWDNQRWWMLDVIERQARWIQFTVNDASGFATTDSSVTVDGVVYFDGFTPATAVTTVYNQPASSNYIFEGDDDDKGFAKYDPKNDKYYIENMECP